MSWRGSSSPSRIERQTSPKSVDWWIPMRKNRKSRRRKKTTRKKTEKKRRGRRRRRRNGRKRRVARKGGRRSSRQLEVKVEGCLWRSTEATIQGE